MSSRSPDPTTLVGRMIVASIGEPWDFRSAAGDNLLTGRVVAVSAPDESVEWLLCDVSPFMIGTQTVSTVAAVRRYADEEPLQQLHARGTTHANLLYDPSGSPLTPDRVRAALAASPTVSTAGVAFLVGSVRLQDAISAAPLA